MTTARDKFFYTRTLCCLLKALEGMKTEIELGNDAHLRGTVQSVSSAMSVTMVNCELIVAGRMRRLDSMFVQGRRIRMVAIPDDIDILKAMEGVIAMYDPSRVKGRNEFRKFPRGRSRGVRGRGATVRMVRGTSSFRGRGEGRQESGRGRGRGRGADANPAQQSCSLLQETVSTDCDSSYTESIRLVKSSTFSNANASESHRTDLRLKLLLQSGTIKASDCDAIEEETECVTIKEDQRKQNKQDQRTSSRHSSHSATSSRHRHSSSPEIIDINSKQTDRSWDTEVYSEGVYRNRSKGRGECSERPRQMERKSQDNDFRREREYRDRGISEVTGGEDEFCDRFRDYQMESEYKVKVLSREVEHRDRRRVSQVQREHGERDLGTDDSEAQHPGIDCRSVRGCRNRGTEAESELRARNSDKERENRDRFTVRDLEREEYSRRRERCSKRDIGREVARLRQKSSHTSRHHRSKSPKSETSASGADIRHKHRLQTKDSEQSQSHAHSAHRQTEMRSKNIQGVSQRSESSGKHWERDDQSARPNRSLRQRDDASDSGPNHRDSSRMLRESSSNHRDSSRTHRESSPNHRDSSRTHRESSLNYRDSTRSNRDSSRTHRGSSSPQPDSSSAHRDSSKIGREIKHGRHSRSKDWDHSDGDRPT